MTSSTTRPSPSGASSSKALATWNTKHGSTSHQITLAPSPCRGSRPTRARCDGFQRKGNSWPARTARMEKVTGRSSTTANRAVMAQSWMQGPCRTATGTARTTLPASDTTTWRTASQTLPS